MKTRMLILWLIVVFCLFFALGWYAERHNRMEAPQPTQKFNEPDNYKQRLIKSSQRIGSQIESLRQKLGQTNESDTAGTGGGMLVTAKAGPAFSNFFAAQCEGCHKEKPCSFSRIASLTPQPQGTNYDEHDNSRATHRDMGGD